MIELRRRWTLVRASLSQSKDPDRFRRQLAQNTVTDVGRHCHLDGAVAIDVAGPSPHVADSFRNVGCNMLVVDVGRGQGTDDDAGPFATVVANAGLLPFGDESVDVSYSGTVYHDTERLTSVLEEMTRVTCPGGVIYLSFAEECSVPLGRGPAGVSSTVGGAVSRAHLNEHGRGRVFSTTVLQVLRWAESRSDVTVFEYFPRQFPQWLRPLGSLPVVQRLLAWDQVVVLGRRDPSQLDVAASVPDVMASQADH